jgi:hypothetical protein
MSIVENAVAREIGDIQSLLNSSSVSVDFTGKPHLVGGHGSIELDSIAERQKNVSTKYQFFSETDRNNGIDCVNKMRAFYAQSDAYTFAKIRNVFDTCVAIISLPSTAFQAFWNWQLPEYSPRECIECNSLNGMGPKSIEWNFRVTGSLPI